MISTFYIALNLENIHLINENTVKLCNFEYAQVYDPNGKLDTFCGSPSYSSPEMINKTKYVGPEVDIWSIGVIMFVLLEGKLPFDEKDMAHKISKANYNTPVNIDIGEKIYTGFCLLFFISRFDVNQQYLGSKHKKTSQHGIY